MVSTGLGTFRCLRTLNCCSGEEDVGADDGDGDGACLEDADGACLGDAEFSLLPGDRSRRSCVLGGCETERLMKFGLITPRAMIDV